MLVEVLDVGGGVGRADGGDEAAVIVVVEEEDEDGGVEVAEEVDDCGRY